MSVLRGFQRAAFLFFVIAVWALPAGATDVPGGSVSGTWTAAGSPYNILGGITVPAGQVLSVDPGVEVIFTGAFRLTVQGSLMALGTGANPVRFHEASVRWSGIRFENAAVPSLLEHCEIQGAEQGVTSVAARVDVLYCLLEDHVTAIHVFGVGTPSPAAVRIDQCVIRQCQQHGIFIVENSNTEVTGCEITQCALDASPRGAIQLSNQSPQGANDPLIAENWIHHNTWQGLTAFDVTGAGRIHPTVLDNTIEYNYTGVYLLYTSGEFRRNQINHNFQAGNPNSGAGVMVYGNTAHPVFTENTTTGNFTGYYIIQGATANLGDLNNAVPTDDGGNRIFGNLDGTGHLWSVYSNTTAAVTAENNVWDSAEPAEIADTIFDYYDNPAYGIVDFDPVMDPTGVPVTLSDARLPRLWLGPGAPNPFSEETRLDFRTTTGGPVRFSVFDAQGRRVRDLDGGAPGRVSWDGRNERGDRLPAGVYLVRLARGEEHIGRRIVLTR